MQLNPCIHYFNRTYKKDSSKKKKKRFAKIGEK